MKTFYLIFSLLILFLASCSEDEPIEKESNKLELTYYEEISEEHHKDKVFTIIEVRPFVKQVSSTDEVNLLQITAKTNHDDSLILFEVFANKVGNNVLYKNVFSFRTSYGTPYSAAVLDFQVLVNNDTEFTANFSGTLDHYNQWVPEYIYINISSGSITFKY